MSFLNLMSVYLCVSALLVELFLLQWRISGEPVRPGFLVMMTVMWPLCLTVALVVILAKARRA